VISGVNLNHFGWQIAATEFLVCIGMLEKDVHPDRVFVSHLELAMAGVYVGLEPQNLARSVVLIEDVTGVEFVELEAR